MRKALFVLIALCAWAATPALAQWQFIDNGAQSEAYVFSPEGARLTVGCYRGQPVWDQMRLSFDLLPYGGAGGHDRDVVVRIGRTTTTITISPVGNGNRGFVRYSGVFTEPRVRAFVADLRRGATARVLPGGWHRGTTFSLSGSRRTLDRLNTACLFARTRPDPLRLPGQSLPRGGDAPPPPPPAAALVPDEALTGLQSYVRDQIAANCAPNVPLTLNEASMFQVSGADVTVWLNQAQCAWTTANNPYCTNGRCTFWVYRYTGGQFSLVRTGQQ